MKGFFKFMKRRSLKAMMSFALAAIFSIGIFPVSAKENTDAETPVLRGGYIPPEAVVIPHGETLDLPIFEIAPSQAGSADTRTPGGSTYCRDNMLYGSEQKAYDEIAAYVDKIYKQTTNYTGKAADNDSIHIENVDVSLSIDETDFDNGTFEKAAQRIYTAFLIDNPQYYILGNKFKIGAYGSEIAAGQMY
jgi:hypothetical protein